MIIETIWKRVRKLRRRYLEGDSYRHKVGRSLARQKGKLAKINLSKGRRR